MNELGADQAAFFEALSVLWGGGDDTFERLPVMVVRKRQRRDGVVGWRTTLPTDYLGKNRLLEVIVPADARSRGVDLYVTPNPYLDWPHVETDGRLCLWPPGLTPIWLPMNELAETTVDRLRWLFGLVDAATGDEERAEEFAREWTSYWELRKRSNHASGRLILVEAPAGTAVMPAIFVSAGGSGKRVIVGSDPEATQHWIAQSAFAPSEATPSNALLVPLRGAPTSPGAPQTTEDISRFVDAWAAEPDIAGPAFESLIQADGEMPRWVLFCHGRDALTALQLTPRFSSLNQRRFRNDRERRHAKARRRLTGMSVSVIAADRVDPGWIYERGRSAVARKLSNYQAVAVGCGSLGSQVVDGLVLSGIETITLVDPDRFEGANTGRHTLGIGSIGEDKVDAIKSKLLADYPHLNIKAHSVKVQDADQVLAQTLADADVVICTSADPACERYLMRRVGDDIRSLLIGWAEPHALAGHSVYLRQPNVPVESLFECDSYRFPAIRWPTDQAEALPGCGASHLPGAGNRIRWIATQIVEHAIHGLTAEDVSDQQRTFVESSEVIAQAGGERIRPAAPGLGVVLEMEVRVPFNESYASGQ